MKRGKIKNLLWQVAWGAMVVEAGSLIAAPQNPPPHPLITPADAAQVRASQEEWAKYLKLPVEKNNSIGMLLVVVPPGEFDMGATPEEVTEAQQQTQEIQDPKRANWISNHVRSELPQHRVTITRPMLFGAKMVTVAEFRRFVVATRYVTEAERRGGGNSIKQQETGQNNKNIYWGSNTTDDNPVAQVTWNDAVAFCQWLSTMERLKPAYRPAGQGNWQLAANSLGYRLPTEAEWEYACRGGTKTKFWFGDSRIDLGKYTFDPTTNASPTVPVANPFGLFDMMGAGRQWCQDWIGDSYYEGSPAYDPPGPADGQARALRGSVKLAPAIEKRSSYRFGYVPYARFGEHGFRVVRNAINNPPASKRLSKP